MSCAEERDPLSSSLLYRHALQMTTDAPGVPGQTTGDVNNFVRPDEMGNVSPAVNARPLSNGYCLSQGITGDTSVRASAAIDEENAPCNLNSGDRIDSQDGSGNIESENNVNSCSANAQFENGNHIGSHPTDNASMIDAALELAPPTNIDKLLAPQTPSTFPTTPRFGQSSIGFPVANGYNVGANHPPPQPPSYEDSSTHFSQPSFPGMDMGTLFGRQHNFGYPPPPYYPSQPSVPTSGIAPPRTEITPQALLSLEDALDRTAVPTPPKRVRDEETSEQKEDGGDSSSSAGKKTGTKRRKNNRGAPKQLGTEGSARSVGNGRKIIPRRNVSLLSLEEHSARYLKLT